MKTLALIIEKNQNEVSKKECEKIRRAVKLEYPTWSLRIVANLSPKDAMDIVEDNDGFVYFKTKDINNDVWAESITTLGANPFEGKNHNGTIALN